MSYSLCNTKPCYELHSHLRNKASTVQLVTIFLAQNNCNSITFWFRYFIFTSGSNDLKLHFICKSNRIQTDDTLVVMSCSNTNSSHLFHRRQPNYHWIFLTICDRKRYVKPCIVTWSFEMHVPAYTIQSAVLIFSYNLIHVLSH